MTATAHHALDADLRRLRELFLKARKPDTSAAEVERRYLAQPRRYVPRGPATLVLHCGTFRREAMVFLSETDRAEAGEILQRLEAAAAAQRTTGWS